MINKILVGIDDSEHAERTLKRAHELQKKLGGKLLVFHSIQHKMISRSIPLPMPAFSAGSVYRIPMVDYRKLEQEYIDHGKNILKKAEKILGKNDPNIETRLITDVKPADYAIATCKEENIDLIMLGSKGDHNVLEKVIGSVSEKVLNHADCDVLLVK